MLVFLLTYMSLPVIVDKILQNKFLKQLYLKVQPNSFLKSSGIVFIVNLIVAAINYTVPIIVRNITDKDFFPKWIALNSTVAITLVIYVALQAEFTKKISAHHTQNSDITAKNYLNFMKGGLLKIFLFSMPILPFIIWVVRFASPSDSWTLATTVVVNLFLQGYAVLHSSYLLGMLKIKDFSIGILLSTFSRPLATTVMLLVGLDLYALPLGYMVFALVLLSHSLWIIKKYDHEKDLQQDKNFVSKDSSSDKTTIFDLKKEFISISKTVFVFFVLSAFLNVSAIIAERTLQNEDRDLFAVLFTFGQIIHFGAVAFLGAFVAYSAKGRNIKLYLTSVIAVSIITITIGLGFWLFGPILLAIMNSTEYTSQIYTILYFSVFVALYNIIFVSAQYLVSQNDYGTILILVFFLIIQIVVLINPVFIGLSNLSLFQFVTINNIVALITTASLVLKILLDHNKLKLKHNL